MRQDPATHIITLNIHRRHLTKEQQAGLIFAIHKAAEEAKAKDAGSKPRQSGEVSTKGGRGKVNKLKAKTVASAKERGISKRTVERFLAKAEGKEPSKRRRRIEAEIERDTFLEFVSNLGVQNDCQAPKLSDAALDLLIMEERADAILTVETAMARLGKLIDRLRNKRVPQEGAPQTRRKRGSPVPGVEPV